MDEGPPPRGRCGAAGLQHLQGPGTFDPLDPSSEPTGKTVFVLDEYYESPSGITAHWQATSTWADFAAALEWMGKATVVTLHNGTVVQGLW